MIGVGQRLGAGIGDPIAECRQQAGETGEGDHREAGPDDQQRAGDARHQGRPAVNADAFLQEQGRKQNREQRRRQQQRGHVGDGDMGDTVDCAHHRRVGRKRPDPIEFPPRHPDRGRACRQDPRPQKQTRD